MASQTTTGLLTVLNQPSPGEKQQPSSPPGASPEFFPPAQTSADYLEGSPDSGLDPTAIDQQYEDVYPVFTAFTSSNAPTVSSSITDPFTGQPYQYGNQVGSVWYTANPVWNPSPPATITSGSYDKTTGLVTLNLSGSLSVSPTDQVDLSGVTGTGSFADLDGVQTCAAGTVSTNTSTTLTFYVTPGLTMTISGGTVAVQNATPPQGFLTGGSLTPPQSVTVDEFEQWPSSYQIYYLYNCPPYPTAVPQGYPTGNPPHSPSVLGDIDIGGPVESGGTPFILSSDLTEAINMTQLNNTSFAALPSQDQINIGATHYFETQGGAAALGLTNSSGGVALLADVQNLFSEIQSDGTLGSPGTFTTPGSGTPLKAPSSALMTQTDADIFNAELANIYKQCQANNFYNLSNIQSQIQAVLTRFQNARALGSIPTSLLPPNKMPGSVTAGNPPYVDVDNLDGVQTGTPALADNASIANGYQNLIQAETNILSIQDNLVNPSSINQNLDAPDIVSAFLIQLKATSDAINAGQAEMVNQQSTLLNAYTQMEQMISQTVAMFDPTSQGQTLTLLNQGSYSSLSTQDQILVSMFNAWSKTSFTQENPIETLQNIPRPLIPIMSNDNGSGFNSYYQSSWNAYNQEIQDSATQIQQNTQLATNTLSAQQQLGDQEYSLANSVLAQANDVIQSIGRGFA